MELVLIVKLNNSFDTTYEEVRITEEEIKQLACEKAINMYIEGHWTDSSAEEDIEIKGKF